MAKKSASVNHCSLLLVVLGTYWLGLGDGKKCICNLRVRVNRRHNRGAHKVYYTIVSVI